VQQVTVDGVAVAVVLRRHPVKVLAGQTLELLSSQIVDSVGPVRRLAHHIVDDVQHVIVTPATRVQSLPVLLTASGVFQVVIYTATLQRQQNQQPSGGSKVWPPVRPVVPL